MADEAVLRRLDRVIAILQLANQEAIEDARKRILSDKINEAVLDTASDWIAAGQLQQVAMQRTRQSQPTVKRRIADLVAQGALEREGRGSSVSYKATGLI